MIKTVVNEFGWRPLDIEKLYCDSQDYHGLVFWYNVIKDLHKQLEKKN